MRNFLCLISTFILPASISLHLRVLDLPGESGTALIIWIKAAEVTERWERLS